MEPMSSEQMNEYGIRAANMAIEGREHLSGEQIDEFIPLLYSFLGSYCAVAMNQGDMEMVVALKSMVNDETLIANQRMMLAVATLAIGFYKTEEEK